MESGGGDVRLPDQLLDAVGQIAESGRIERFGARVNYIVGNSVFYGVRVATEKVYAALMRRARFECPIRKGHSKKARVEAAFPARGRRGHGRRCLLRAVGAGVGCRLLLSESGAQLRDDPGPTLLVELQESVDSVGNPP